MAKTFLRWAGSKRQILPRLSQLWKSDFDRYVEPFAGSACLFFYIQPPDALLGDINEDLMSMFRTVKETPGEVSACLERYSPSEDDYYQVRALDPRDLPRTERAARFIYLNRYCFNGLYRTNRRGEFNVPYGGTKSGTLPTPSELSDASVLLRRAELLSGDFVQTLEHVRKGDFVYIDPPYSVKSRRVFNEYDRNAFRPSDLDRLKEWLVEIDGRGATFVVSYAKSREAAVLAQPYFSKVLRVRRNIAGFAKNRRTYMEVIISNQPLVLPRGC